MLPRWASGWEAALVVALSVHAGVLAIPLDYAPSEPPLEFVDFELAEEPPPAAEVEPEPESEPPEEPEPPPEPPEELPPPPELVEEVQAPAGELVDDPARDPNLTSVTSNRPDGEAADEEVPVVTGLPLDADQLTEGGMGVRVGNTNEAGYDAPEGADLSALQGFKGGGQGGGGTTGTASAGVTEKAEVLRAYVPRYPKDMLEAGIEGAVKLRVEVLTNGRAGRVEVVSGLHPRLDMLSVDAARRCRFKPARRDQEKVVSTIPLTIIFKIEQ